MISAKKIGNPKFIANARKYCQRVKQRFGEHFRAIGVDLDKIVDDESTSSTPSQT